MFYRVLPIPRLSTDDNDAGRDNRIGTLQHEVGILTRFSNAIFRGTS